MRGVVIAALAATVVLPACSKPNAPTEANLRKALEPLVADAFCRPVPGATWSTSPPGLVDPPFPIMIRASTDRDFGETRRGRAALETATAAGLLTRTALRAPARYRNSRDALAPTTLLAFAPTEAGRTVFQVTGSAGATGGEHPSICLAHGTVEKVLRWTGPVDTPVGRIVRVTYAYAPVNVAPGFEGPADLGGAKEATVVLVQTDDGWAKAGR